MKRINSLYLIEGFDLFSIKWEQIKAQKSSIITTSPCKTAAKIILSIVKIFPLSYLNIYVTKTSQYLSYAFLCTLLVPVHKLQSHAFHTQPPPNLTAHRHGLLFVVRDKYQDVRRGDSDRIAREHSIEMPYRVRRAVARAQRRTSKRAASDAFAVGSVRRNVLVVATLIEAPEKSAYKCPINVAR